MTALLAQVTGVLEWLLGGAPGNAGGLVFTGEPWMVAAGAVCVAVALVLAAFPSLRGRVAELLLATLAAAALLFVLAGPVWRVEGERREPGRFVVLVDASRSMAVRENGGAERSDSVAEILENVGPADYYHFADTLRPGLPNAYDGGDSDLGGALAAIAQRYAGERLEGIAVVTDGLDRGGLRRRLASGEATLPRLNGPLTLYQAGSPAARVDAAVGEVQGPDFAFVRSPFELSVPVHVSGVKRAAIQVTLLKDGQPAGSKTVTLDAEGEGKVAFTLTPSEPGRSIYELSVPLIEGDAIPANNMANVAVRAVRERVRVLQVCGAPSWDQKFLRLFLKEDPGVDLVSFFILRTERDFGSGYSPEELSLIQFPYRKLFTSELPYFDLVVLQNFDYAPYFERDANVLLGNMAQYVKDGGALVMIGGDRSFDLGKYHGTSLGDVLPVKLGVSGDPVDESAFSPALTAAGTRHPITQLVPDPAENAAMWAALSPLDGLNRSMGKAEGAAVLLAHPSLKTPGGEPLPVVAVREVGKGRTMALMGDSSWRWFLGEAAEGRGNQAYLRFWKNSMRWLVGDPEDQPVVVEVGKENYAPGEEVVVRVAARDTGFGALAGATVTLAVTGPEKKQERTEITGADGVAVFRLSPEGRGAWQLSAVARRADGKILGKATTAFAVSARDPELEEIEPDAAFLQAFAEKAGGLYVAPGTASEPLRDVTAGRVVNNREEVALYAAPILPILFGVAASLSWWLRRRAGLR